MSANPGICPKCATPLPSDAPRALCPQCLLLGGFADGDSSESNSSPVLPRERNNHSFVPRDEPGSVMPETLRYFGDYELLEQIAVGGMGVVFKARQVSLNRLVAVKLIRAGQLAREDDIRRFRTEAEAAASLNHPHIVAIHEVGEHDGRHFFSMDYIEGRTLAELVRDQPLEPERAARLIQTVAEAIADAHGRGVLHRDLKPSNVMIDAQDQPHVTDFGLAKMLKGDSDLTMTGAVLGSPSYMSPEQARGRGDQVSVCSDVYALGAVLYELLTARPPFLAATPLATMKQVAEQEPVAPRALNPSAPQDLETICLKCLQKDPAHRYASAGALAEDLARWQRHEPIRARPSSAWEKGMKFARRRPALAGLLAVSAAAVTGFVALIFIMNFQVTRERNRAVNSEQRATNALAHAEAATRREQTNALTARQNLYAADLFQASQFVEAGQLGPALARLEAHRPSPGEIDLRGFEWRYLRAQCNGTHVRVLRGHEAPVHTLAFSHDGRRLASGDSGTVVLWNMENGVKEKVIPDTSDTAVFLNNTAQTTTLLANDLPGTIGALFNGGTLRPLIEKSTGRRARATLTLAFSPDGHTLATGGGNNEYLKFWKVSTRRQTGWLPESSSRIAFLPGTNLAFIGIGFNMAGQRSGETRLYDWVANKPLLTLSNSGGLLSLSADGRTLATADLSGRVHVWDTATCTERISFTAAWANLQCFALSPDGRTVALRFKDSMHFQLWDAVQGRGLATGDCAHLTTLAFSPDSRLLATAGADATVHLWDARTAQALGRLDGHRDAVQSLAFSPDGRLLGAGSRDGTIRLWNMPPPKTGLDGPAFELLPPLVFSEDSRRLAGVNRSGQPAVWNVNGTALTPLGDHTNAFPLYFSPDGETLTCVTRADQVAPWQLETWDVSTPVLRSRVRLPESESINLMFAANRARRRLVGYGRRPSRLMVWNADSAALEREFSHPPAPDGYMQLSPDGRWLAIGSEPSESGWGRLSLWDADHGTHLRDIVGPHIPPRALAFAPDSRTLTTGGVDNKIRLWDVPAGSLRAVLAGHGGTPHLLAVSPDNRTLSVAASDGTLKVWSLATQRELGAFLVRAGCRTMAFSPDGRLLCAPVWGPKVIVWRAPTLDELDRQP